MRVRTRFLLGALVALLALPFVLLVLLLAIEFKLPLDDQRVAIAMAASSALGTEVNLGGPLYFITGAHPGIEASGLHVAGRFKARQISVDAGLARARLHWRALLEGNIRLSEISVEAAKVCVDTYAGAPPEVTAATGRDGGTWQLTGIDSLRIDLAALGTGPDCAALSGPVQLRSFGASATGGEALRVAATVAIAGEAWLLDLSGPMLSSLVDASAPVPFKLSAGSAEGKLSADGKLLLSPFSAEADVVFDSPQFAKHLRPLGAPFKGFGPLLVRAHVRADAHRLSSRLYEVRLTPGTARGEFSLDWSRTQRATGRGSAAALAGGFRRFRAPASGAPAAAAHRRGARQRRHSGHRCRAGGCRRRCVRRRADRRKLGRGQGEGLIRCAIRQVNHQGEPGCGCTQ
jgi:hypothetical protein